MGERHGGQQKAWRIQQLPHLPASPSARPSKRDSIRSGREAELVFGIVDGLPDCFCNIAFRGGQDRDREGVKNWLCEVCRAAGKEFRDRKDGIRLEPGGWRITRFDQLHADPEITGLMRKRSREAFNGLFGGGISCRGWDFPKVTLDVTLMMVPFWRSRI